MKITRYLPSRQFSFILISFLIAGLLIYGASFLGKGKSLASISLTPTESKETIASIDTDSDGLPDWEEGVRGTDPQKVDTDNDATSDGEEIRSGRNPLKAGPNDSLVSEQDTKLMEELLAAASSTNLTDAVSRGIFAQYVASKQSGASPNAQDQAVADAIAKASIPLSGKIYASSDLTIIQKSDEASVRTFANAMIRIIDAYPNARFQNVISALTSTIDRGDRNASTNLVRMGSDYQTIARDLSRIPVPAKFTQSYLALINSLEHAGASLTDLSVVNEDPIRATAGLKNFNDMTSSGTLHIAELAVLILQTGIKFKPEEPGYQFALFITAGNPAYYSQ